MDQFSSLGQIRMSLDLLTSIVLWMEVDSVIASRLVASDYRELFPCNIEVPV